MHSLILWIFRTGGSCSINNFNNNIKSMTDNSGINNYKGVMLCSRPNQAVGIQKQKIFCARVVPNQKLGLVPTKKFDELKVRKKVNPVLNNHLRWLQEFKDKVKQQKEQAEQEKQKEVERLEKIKMQGKAERQKINQSNIQDKQLPKQQIQISKDKQNQASKIEQRTQQRYPKMNEKPAWAQTEQQAQKKQKKQVDQLLDFFNNTDIQKYIDQVEVNALMSSLKQKIEQIKKDKDWKVKNIDSYKQKAKQIQEKEQDRRTNASKNSVAKSVASQKTAEKIQQLKQKLQKQKEGQQQDWDKHTKTSKHSYANIEERIAKNVADDILRNYGNLKGVHSNQSMRKMLEKEAAKQLQEKEEDNNPK